MKIKLKIIALIFVIIGCKNNTNQNENIPKQNVESIKENHKDDKFLVDLNDVPKKWDELTGKNGVLVDGKSIKGDTVIFYECFSSPESDYEIKQNNNKWVIIYLEPFEVTTFFITSTFMDKKDLVLKIIADYNTDGETHEFRILNYEPKMKTALLQTPHFKDLLFTSEYGYNDYTIQKTPCYRCNDSYCPEENPNLLVDLSKNIPKNRLIIPGKMVGEITAKSTISQINKLFDNKIVESKYNSNGTEITHIKLSEGNEVYINWTEKPVKPYSITIKGKKSDFITNKGIGIGSTIEEVEKAYWSLFEIHGFEIDQDLAGRIISWKNPSYSNIQFKFTTTKDLELETYNKITGFEPILSNNTFLGKDYANCVVDEITVFFNGNIEGEFLYQKEDLTIFNNKAYYKNIEIYDGTKDLLDLIENEETEDCPVDYIITYEPLSLLGEYLSVKKTESGVMACGTPEGFSKTFTINYKTQKTVAIEDLFTEKSILNALKNDSWVKQKAQKFNKNLSDINSVNQMFDLLSEIDGIDTPVSKTSFSIYNISKGEVAVRLLLGYRTQIVDKVVLGLSLELKNKDLIKTLKFSLKNPLTKK